MFTKEQRDHAERQLRKPIYDDLLRANSEIAQLRKDRDELREALARCQPLIRLLSVRQVIESNNDAIEAAGLNPWCINEGLAEGHETISTWWIDATLDKPASGE